jgi:hypothetical protein
MACTIIGFEQQSQEWKDEKQATADERTVFPRAPNSRIFVRPVENLRILVGSLLSHCPPAETCVEPQTRTGAQTWAKN